MKSGRIVSGLFLAALTALFVWAILTGVFRDFLTDSARFFGIENWAGATASEDDVLFDDDSTVDWSDPITEVFDASVTQVEYSEGDSTDGSEETFYEMVLTPEYFNALLQKYSGSALSEVSSAFKNGQVVLSGKVNIPSLTEQVKIPAALVLFLPKNVSCTLHCVPQVSEGRMMVSVSNVEAGSEVLKPFLGRPEVVSSVEDFLNEQLTKYLADNYVMQSVRISDFGMTVRFSVQ